MKYFIVLIHQNKVAGRDGSVGIMTGLPAGRSMGSISGRGKRYFIGLAMGPTHYPIQLIPGSVSDHAPLPRIELKNKCNYTSTPPPPKYVFITSTRTQQKGQLVFIANRFYIICHAWPCDDKNGVTVLLLIQTQQTLMWLRESCANGDKCGYVSHVQTVT
jgi:hypothetical protein